MKVYSNTTEAVSTELLLWQKPSTNVSIDDTYDLKIYPRESVSKNAPVSFVLAPQQQGMLRNIDVITELNLKKDGEDVPIADQVTPVNNIANAIWGLVNIKISDRVDIMQSMRNSYAYTTYFDTVLNVDPNRLDILRKEQMFIMDSGLSKEDADDTTLTGLNNSYGLDYDDVETYIDTETEVKTEGGESKQKSKIARYAANLAGLRRRRAMLDGRVVRTKLHCPLFNSHKALPPNMDIRITLTKNLDKFLLLANSEEDYTLDIKSVYLTATYIRPSQVFLNLLEERLAKEAAPYYVTKPELIVKPVGQEKFIRLNNLFLNNRIPHHAFFCLQYSKHFDGSYSGNPFAFVPFTSFQLHLDGKPYFPTPLSTTPYTSRGKSVYDKDGHFLSQLYSSIGKKDRGVCLIDSSNFNQNFIVGVCMQTEQNGETAHGYLSPQRFASTNLEIELHAAETDDLVLIIYAIYDRLIKISGDRSIEIVE